MALNPGSMQMSVFPTAPTGVGNLGQSVTPQQVAAAQQSAFALQQGLADSYERPMKTQADMAKMAATIQQLPIQTQQMLLQNSALQTATRNALLSGDWQALQNATNLATQKSAEQSANAANAATAAAANVQAAVAAGQLPTAQDISATQGQTALTNAKTGQAQASITNDLVSRYGLPTADANAVANYISAKRNETAQQVSLNFLNSFGGVPANPATVPAQSTSVPSPTPGTLAPPLQGFSPPSPTPGTLAPPLQGFSSPNLDSGVPLSVTASQSSPSSIADTLSTLGGLSKAASVLSATPTLDTAKANPITIPTTAGTAQPYKSATGQVFADLNQGNPAPVPFAGFQQAPSGVMYRQLAPNLIQTPIVTNGRTTGMMNYDTASGASQQSPAPQPLKRREYVMDTQGLVQTDSSGNPEYQEVDVDAVTGRQIDSGAIQTLKVNPEMNAEVKARQNQLPKTITDLENVRNSVASGDQGPAIWVNNWTNGLGKALGMNSADSQLRNSMTALKSQVVSAMGTGQSAPSGVTLQTLSDMMPDGSELSKGAFLDKLDHVINALKMRQSSLGQTNGGAVAAAPTVPPSGSISTDLGTSNYRIVSPGTATTP